MEVSKGYKQTEVGIIPSDWEIKTLSSFAELTSSKRIFESDYVSSGIPFYRGKEISLLINNAPLDDEYFILEEKYNEIKRQFGAPRKGDILITAVGTLGNVYLVPNDNAFYFKDGNLIWLRNIKNVLPDYLTIQLRNRKTEILNNAIGSTQKALTIIVLNETLIPIPPTLAEQEAIAEALSDADALIEAVEQLLTKKRQVKQGAMSELLTGKRRLSGFSGEWNEKQLGDVIKEIGDGATPSTSNPMNFGGSIHWVVIEDIKDEITTTKSTLTERGLHSCPAKLWQPGTLIVSTGATIGEVGIARVPLATKQGICGIVVNNAMADTVFLKFWFVGNKSKLLAKAQGSTIKEVRAPTLVQFEISLPHIAEQTAIAEILSDMDAEITALEGKLVKSRQVKAGMMSELLTGKVRLV
jgi:type I restriction enzyme S subunit